jgi:hypothetical protein
MLSRLAILILVAGVVERAGSIVMAEGWNTSVEMASSS